MRCSGFTRSRSRVVRKCGAWRTSLQGAMARWLTRCGARSRQSLPTSSAATARTAASGFMSSLSRVRHAHRPCPRAHRSLDRQRTVVRSRREPRHAVRRRRRARSSTRVPVPGGKRQTRARIDRRTEPDSSIRSRMAHRPNSRGMVDWRAAGRRMPRGAPADPQRARFWSPCAQCSALVRLLDDIVATQV